jgi:hypothetical protein
MGLVIFKKIDPSLLAIEKLQKQFLKKKSISIFIFIFPPHLGSLKKGCSSPVQIGEHVAPNLSGSILFKSNIFGT